MCPVFVFLDIVYKLVVYFGLDIITRSYKDRSEQCHHIKLNFAWFSWTAKYRHKLQYIISYCL